MSKNQSNNFAGQVDPRQYAKDVLAGKIKVCSLVKAAIDRNSRDLKNGHKRGLYFDHEAGARAVRFFSLLKFYEGDVAGQPFMLAPYQAWITYTVYGWKKADGTRRFNYAYIEVAKKNGKTPWMSGHALYHLVADGEGAPQVYTAAAARDQASICFRHAKTMASNAEMLRPYLNVQEHSIMSKENDGFMKALSAEHKTMEGINVHAAIVDEYHVHPNDGVFESIKSATVARSNPLVWIITTAGFDKNGPCYNYRKMVINLLKQRVQDDSLFGIIYTLDQGDKWQDPEVWIKSNPNLGVSVKESALQREMTNAINQPSKLTNFLTKNMNVWTDTQTSWIKEEDWMKCSEPIDHEELKGCIAYGGLDLSQRRDLTAFALLFPFIDNDGEVTFKWLRKYYMPADNIKAKVDNDGVAYDQWVREGLITATPGNIVDYAYIRSDVLEASEKYELVGVAYDQFGSTQLATELSERGLNMVQWHQGVSRMSPGIKEMEAIILQQKLTHEGDPVLAWMAGNVVLKINEYGDGMISKKDRVARVDGIVAGVMALAYYMSDRRENLKDQQKEATQGMIVIRL